MFALIFAGIGLLIGNLIDRFRSVVGPNPARIGIWELLNVIALVAFIILLVQIAPKILK